MELVQTQKQPKVFYLAFLAALGERFGYYVVNFLLVLYLKYVCAFSDTKAFELVGLFVAMSYIVPAIGGFLADKIIGVKRCFGLGLLIEMLGFFVLAVPSNNPNQFYFALSLIVVGCGIFKPAPTNLLGRAYGKNDPRIDSGFTLYYMAINIGSFLSALVAGPVKDFCGWNISFLLAALGLIFAFFWFMFLKHHGEELDTDIGKQHFSLQKWSYTVAVSIAGVLLVTLFFKYLSLGSFCIFILSAAIFIYLIYEIIIAKQEERWGIIVALILIALNFATFLMYFQLFESIELFIERNVNRAVFGFNLATPIYLGFNGLCVIFLSPILAHMYKTLEQKKKDLSITTKIPVGIFILSSCFIFLYFCSFFAGADYKVPGFLVMIAIAFYTLGELLTSALGFSIVTKLVPARLYGTMMGVWFLLAVGLPGKVSGNVAALAKVPENMINNLQFSLGVYAHAFLIIGFGGAIVAIFGFLIAPWLKRKGNLGN